jgi:hypothetical protein
VCGGGARLSAAEHVERLDVAAAVDQLEGGQVEEEVIAESLDVWGEGKGVRQPE